MVKNIEKLNDCTVQLELFKKKEVRKIFRNTEWWFSIVDICEALIETESPRRYWTELKKKLFNETEESQLLDFIEQLTLPSSDGKKYKTDCANIEGILRIIQSIPSKKVEPFKRWLAKTGFERIQEEEKPELAIQRAMLNYANRGRDKKWIQDRVQNIQVRKNLTDEWKGRGVEEGSQYGTLTNTISKGTFGMDTKEYKTLKELKQHHSLRDNMSSLELIFNRLGEEATMINAQSSNAQGFQENLNSATKGGKSAGVAREAFEKENGQKVLTSKNFINNIKQDKLEFKDKPLTEKGLKDIVLYKKDD